MMESVAFVIDAATDTHTHRIEGVDFMKEKNKQLFMEAQYSPGALFPFT